MTVASAVLEVGSRDHIVQFYRDEEELAGQVGDYLLESVRDDGVAVVIATRAHRLAFEARLAGAGVDVAAMRARGGYLEFDVKETLDLFCDGGTIDVARFDAVIGGVIRRAVASERPVRAFGEMVALLWDAGMVAAAIELEALWNGLGHRQRFSLLCAYPAVSVAGDGHAAAFAEVCQLHTGIIGDPAAVDGAMTGQVWEFPASLDAVTRARHLVTAAMHDGGAGDLASDAALVVTELAANAVVHARSAFTVTLTAGQDTVRICVRDTVPLPAGDAGLPAEPLHGLGAVAAMAARWGAEEVVGGKDVWAELPR